MSELREAAQRLYNCCTDSNPFSPISEVSEALDDMKDALAAPEWLPKEQAPKDDSRILSFYYGEYEILHWSDKNQTHVDDYGNALFFTVWQALPAAPITQ